MRLCEAECEAECAAVCEAVLEVVGEAVGEAVCEVIYEGCVRLCVKVCVRLWVSFSAHRLSSPCLEHAILSGSRQSLHSRSYPGNGRAMQVRAERC